MTPYEVVYDQQPSSVVSYLLGTSKLPVVDSLLHNHDATLFIIKENLVMAQNRMKQQTNQHCSECSFLEGD